MTEEREGGGGWMGDAGRRSVQHCVQLVCQVVKHAADVVQDGHRSLLTGKEMSNQTRVSIFKNSPLMYLSHALFHMFDTWLFYFQEACYHSDHRFLRGKSAT